MSDPVQFILLLDVDGPANLPAIEPHLPPVREARHVLRMTEHGRYERPPTRVDRDRLDWPRIEQALLRLDARMRALWPEDRPVEIYVAGGAPLTVYFALGTVLDVRNATVTAASQRRNEPDRWDLIEMRPDPAGAVLFEEEGLEKQVRGTGEVAFSCTTMATGAVQADILRDAVLAHGADLLDIVALRSSEALNLDRTTMPGVLHQLSEAFVRLATCYPHRRGLTMCLGGPAFLALGAGIVLNGNQHMGGGKKVTVTEYVAGDYIPVLTLPLVGAVPSEIPDDAEAKLARRETFDHIRSGIEDLGRRLSKHEPYMPAGFVGNEQAKRSVLERAMMRISQLQAAREPGEGAFAIDALTHVLSMGPLLLHPLVEAPPDALNRLGQLFALHEGVHEDQGIGSHNYNGIGRSGVALEEVDFWADAFAIGNASLMQIRRSGEDGNERSAEILTSFIDAHLAAMRAFDVSEQGESRLVRMPERRLRRYLIWHLQRARAKSVRCAQDIEQLLDERVVVELAPLAGYLDDRGDKLVDRSRGDTTLTMCIGGRLRRFPALPGNFEPAELVAAVRTFDFAKLAEAMTYVCAEAKDLLCRWV